VRRVPWGSNSERKVPARVFDGLGAGLVAGAFAGAVEVAWLVWYTGRLDMVTALAYAVLAYGLLGALAGLILGVVSSFALRGGVSSPSAARVTYPRRASRSFTWSLGVGLVTAGLLAPIAVYRARADGQLDAVGQAIAAGLVLLAGLGLFLVLRRLTRGRLAILTRLPGSVALYLLILLAAWSLGWLAGAANAAPRPAASIPPDLRDKPNIIVIVADALRADRLSCYTQCPADGYTKNQTPQIDALARDGVLYREMSAQASWTKPSVGTILTSLYPSSHQAVHAESQLPAAATALAEVLSVNGYRTAGLVTNAYITPLFGFDQGFDSYVYLEPDDPFFAPSAATRLAIHRALMRTDLGRWQRQTFGTWPGPYYREAEVVNAHLLPWLEAQRTGRFFVYVHYMDPHTPYFRHPYDGTAFMDALPPDQAGWVSSLYDGEVVYLDAHLGALFDALKTWGLYDDALIVFTADHGEEFFEHGGWGHGATLYEEQLRVPLIVKYPGGQYAGTVDEGCARSLDLAPTVLDVTGIPIPGTMQGVSLRPGENALPRATVLLAETIYQARYTMQAVRVGSRKLIRTAPDHPRLIPPTLLFDLAADPGEHHDRATAEPDVIRTLQTELDRVLAFARERAVAGQASPVDPATRERLRNLGY